MEEIADIPIPIRFNPFKHHRNYILSMLKMVSADEIVGLLDPICNNYIDIYTGRLSPDQIGGGVISFLESCGLLLSSDFDSWVATTNGYRQIILEDESEWIIRKSNENERYIHIHPARVGGYTTRYKGSTLKTIYLVKINSLDFEKTISLEAVNQVRLLGGLSPIKKLERSKGILNCYERFFDQEFTIL